MFTLDTEQHLVRMLVRSGLVEAHELVRPIDQKRPPAAPYDATIDHNRGYELRAHTYADLNAALKLHSALLNEYGKHRSLHRWVVRAKLGIAWSHDAIEALHHHVPLDELLGLTSEVLLGSQQTLLDYLDREDIPYDGMIAQVRKVLGLAQLATATA
jgi:hypothetical protein